MKCIFSNVLKHPVTSGMGGVIILFVIIAHYSGVDKDTTLAVITALSVGGLSLSRDPKGD